MKKILPLFAALSIFLCQSADATVPRALAASSSGSSSGVSSLNSLTGALNIVAGTNITVTPSGSSVTISASGGGGGTLGTSVTAASPQVSGDATTGLYTPSAGEVGVATSGIQDILFPGNITHTTATVAINVLANNGTTGIPVTNSAGIVAGDTIAGTNITPGTEIYAVLGTSTTPTSTTAPISVAPGQQTFAVNSTVGFSVGQMMYDSTNPAALGNLDVTQATPYPIALQIGNALTTTANGNSASGQGLITVNSTTNAQAGYWIYDVTNPSATPYGMSVYSVNAGTSLYSLTNLTAQINNGDTIKAYPTIYFETVISPGISAGDTIISYPTLAPNVILGAQTAGATVTATSNNHSSSSPGAAYVDSGFYVLGDITVANGLSFAGGNLINTFDGSSLAIGPGALANLLNNGLEAPANIAVGSGAMHLMTYGYENTCEGGGCMGADTTSSYNECGGYGCLASMLGTSNGGNVCHGNTCMPSLTSGSTNTGNGRNVFSALTTGSNNVGEGYKACSNVTTGGGNLCYGANTTVPTGSTSNYLNLGFLLLGDATYSGTTLGDEALFLQSVANAVDHVTVTPGVTGNPGTATLSATGTDTNINLNLASKGTGTVEINGSPIVAGSTGQILYNNAGAVGALSTSGTGNVALTTSPAFTTPSLGAATATSINGNAITTGTGTLTLGAAKTLTANNSLTLAGADSTTETFPTVSSNIHGTLSAQYSTSDTNNSSSGSGSFFDHATTYAIPANYLTSNKVLRVTATFLITTGSGAPTWASRLKAGSTVIYSESGAGTPSNSLTGNVFSVMYLLQGTAAAGASANVLTVVNGIPNSVNAVINMNNTSQPVALATNGSLTLTVGTEWGSAGTGTNTCTLTSLIVEAVN